MELNNKLNLNYMYRVKFFTERFIKENPELKQQVEDKYYTLLIKIAKNKCENRDFRKFAIEMIALKS